MRHQSRPKKITTAAIRLQAMPLALPKKEEPDPKTNRFPVWCYVARNPERGKKVPRQQPKHKSKEERPLCCVHCRHPITRSIFKISVQGAFEHTFLNPAGQVFRLGCFQSADGCLVIGEPTLEWTWFQGFQWQVALCGQCLNHLGWFYRSGDGPGFFGLIAEALI